MTREDLEQIGNMLDAKIEPIRNDIAVLKHEIKATEERLVKKIEATQEDTIKALSEVINFILVFGERDESDFKDEIVSRHSARCRYRSARIPRRFTKNQDEPIFREAMRTIFSPILMKGVPRHWKQGVLASQQCSQNYYT